MTILVVDDESRIRAIIRKYAEFEGHTVSEAGDGMEAVRLCRREKFDIIIMDIMMPELDGFSACREIRKASQTPIIMLSARGEEYDRINGFELGVDDYVVKPFNTRELLLRSRKAESEGSAVIFTGEGTPYEAKDPDPDSLSEILFTTGTTGKSKGVMVSFANQVNIALAGIETTNIQPDNVWLIPTPMNHAAGLRKTHMSMVRGSTVLLMNGFTNLRLFFQNIRL